MNFKFIIISRTHLVNKSLYLPPVPVGLGGQREREREMHMCMFTKESTVMQSC